jgi:hypothetical protein
VELERIPHILRDDLDSAKKQLKAASSKFDEVVRDVPSALPHPDGTYRIRKVSVEYSIARERLIIAHTRLNDFLTRGVIPEDLKTSK